MSQLITSGLVSLDEPLGTSKDEVIASLAGLVAAAGRSDDPAGLTQDAYARESKSATGMPGGLAIPHCRSEHVSESTLVFARLAPAVDFGAKDGPADLVFMIAAPAAGDQEHMKLLTQLARALVRKDFTDSLRSATSRDEVVRLVSEVVKPPAAPSAAAAPAAQPTGVTAAAGTGAAAAAAGGGATSTVTEDRPTAASADHGEGPLSIVAVTSCPTGIAHTYMAAEALEHAGKKAGVEVHVEPQGSVGAETLDPAVIRAASAVIFATDVGVRDKHRFAGLAEINSGVKAGIHEADSLVARAIAAAKDPSAPRVAATADSGEPGPSAASQHIGVRIRTALLTGVSYMIPFVAAGGLLIALGFLVGGYKITATAEKVVLGNSLWDLPAGGLSQYLGALLFQVGAWAFAFLVPALAGYIAYAIADRPGIAPGFVIGFVAGQIGAGFLGGLIGGLLAGAVALWISRFKVPAFARGLMPVVVIPLFATVISSGLMILVLGRPIAALTKALTTWLSGLSGSSAIILGIILGAMMCFDMGGPVNKAAYVFATTGLNLQNPATLKIMAAVMAAGMVPPLALALASAVAPGLFTPAERENGKAAWLLGASFISEGAIPFAAADPLRVIPPMMLGGAVTGAVSMASGVQLSAPHGGIFVLFAITGVLLFLLSLVVGTVVGSAAVVAAKRYWHRDTDTRKEAVAAPAAA
ncbi:MAG TPA: fructose-specific PTS transporter subunit EIIC [Intrasporangium sp.]|uniref:PTS fructose transporter subunit IIABC n=1 Tax=Intrasporangium sp. TaxID=1925024 RepID=UPI002D778395|nr:fructose-specific PTS transporter subunit EIIC [Intrasporangium sp.]HET7398097.1 fructose-specific PTS transporter subunit EIIC [Intrasporangium sp.]